MFVLYSQQCCCAFRAVEMVGRLLALFGLVAATSSRSLVDDFAARFSLTKINLVSQGGGGRPRFSPRFVKDLSLSYQVISRQVDWHNLLLKKVDFEVLAASPSGVPRDCSAGFKGAVNVAFLDDVVGALNSLVHTCQDPNLWLIQRRILGIVQALFMQSSLSRRCSKSAKV